MSIEAIYSQSINCHVIYSKDGLISDFALNEIKSKYGLSANDVIDVETKADVQEAFNYTYLAPENFEKWVINVHLDKVGLVNEVKGFQKSIRGLNNMIVLFTTTRWKVYQSALKSFSNYNEIMGSYIRYADLQLILKKSGISLDRNLVWFLTMNYGSAPSSIFKLIRRIKDGERVHSKKEIISILGLSADSIVSFALSTLAMGTADTPRKIKSRSSALVQQAELLNNKLGTRNFWAQLYLTLWDMREVRRMYATGKVYKEFYKPLEDYEKRRKQRAISIFGSRYNYREANINYYNRLLDKTSIFSTVEIDRALLTLDPQNAWSTYDDMLLWLYKFISITVSTAKKAS